MSTLESDVVLIGFMAVGKTTVARALGARWRVPFVDADQELVKKHGPIADLFRAYGERHFRQLEAATIARIFERAKEPLVLALGGGAVLDEGTQQLLRSRTVIFLDTDLEHILPRIERDRVRPLLAQNAAENWQRLADRRRPLYEQTMTHRVDTRGLDLEAIVDRIEDIVLGGNARDETITKTENPKA